MKPLTIPIKGLYFGQIKAGTVSSDTIRRAIPPLKPLVTGVEPR